MGGMIKKFRLFVFYIKVKFNKRLAKRIFHLASLYLDMFMCNSLEIVIAFEYGVHVKQKKMEKILGKYGFTRKNYHEFVKTNYPDLVPYLEKDAAYWIRLRNLETKKRFSMVVESKREFLKELSNRI